MNRWNRTSGVAGAVLSGVLLVGCTSLTLPTSKGLEENGPKDTNADNCGKDKETALKCARYLRDSFAALETTVGKSEAIYSYLTVAFAALTAIYLKSADDHSQAIEDLAVGVATLAGFRAVYNPTQRLKVATEGRRAVECMIQTVDGIEALQKEVSPESIVPAVKAAPESGVAPAGKPKFSAFGKPAKSAVAPPTVVPEKMRRMPYDTPQSIVALNSALDRYFQTPELEEKINKTPKAALAAGDARQYKQAVLVHQQVIELNKAKAVTKAAVEAAAEPDLLAKRLAFGLHQVLDNARLALAHASLPTDNMLISQRDTVQKMIGQLANKVEDEQEQAQETAGAVATTGDTEANQQASQTKNESQTPAHHELQQVYKNCGGEAK